MVIHALGVARVQVGGVRVAQVSVAQVSVRHVHVAQVRVAKMRVANVRVREVAISKVAIPVMPAKEVPVAAMIEAGPRHPGRRRQPPPACQRRRRAATRTACYQHHQAPENLVQRGQAGTTRPSCCPPCLDGSTLIIAWRPRVRAFRGVAQSGAGRAHYANTTDAPSCTAWAISTERSASARDGVGARPSWRARTNASDSP